MLLDFCVFKTCTALLNLFVLRPCAMPTYVAYVRKIIIGVLFSFLFLSCLLWESLFFCFFLENTHIKVREGGREGGSREN